MDRAGPETGRARAGRSGQPGWRSTSAGVCGSHIERSVPSEQLRITGGPSSGPSSSWATSTLMRAPAAVRARPAPARSARRSRRGIRRGSSAASRPSAPRDLGHSKACQRAPRETLAPLASTPPRPRRPAPAQRAVRSTPKAPPRRSRSSRAHRSSPDRGACARRRHQPLEQLAKRGGGGAGQAQQLDRTAPTPPARRPRRARAPGTIDARIVATRPGARWAHAITATAPTGLRLCGIVEEPPRPSPAPSAASATSV